ncbi:ATP-utilizing chromatin assembly and remodelling N-terminal-domain-containing protein, partial [Blyttiomyces helicus]
MPLLKRKPHDLIPLLPEEEWPDMEAEVYQVDASGEIFLNYDDYLARAMLYQKRVFSCEKTGRLNLTYAEAVNSEREVKRTMDRLFPEVWRKPALEVVHYCSMDLNKLSTTLYDFFKDRLYIGEEVFAEIDGCTYSGTVLTQLDPTPEPPQATPSTKFEILLRQDLHALFGPDSDGKHVVEMCNIRRDRVVLSKQNFRRFARQVATKEVYMGAPWIVK